MESILPLYIDHILDDNFELHEDNLEDQYASDIFVYRKAYRYADHIR